MQSARAAAATPSLYESADETAFWAALPESGLFCTWTIPGTDLRMPTTLLTGESEGGFETRPYRTNWRGNQNQLVPFDRLDILQVT